jgi:NTE family protein
MPIKKILTTFFLLSILLSTLSAQVKAGNKRPKIGLVLSGGGARGFAHVGVLKVLEEAGIRPDYITGTSMGSIIGALYAIGYDAESLEKIVRKLNWNEILEDKAKREFLGIESKNKDDYVVTFPIEDRSIKLPKGLISGRKFSLYLSRYTMPAHGIKEFKNFPIPFKCVSTNLLNGEAVVFDKGNLSDALRASMSIPSVFSPLEHDDKLLIDGGIVRNLPVRDVINMGADIVIGVDISTPLHDKKNLRSFLNVIDQTVSYQINKSTSKEKTLCNYLITPDIQGYSSTDFQAVDSLIVKGERAARKKLPLFLFLADEQTAYDDNTKNIKAVSSFNMSEKKEVLLGKINVVGLTNYSRRMIESKMGVLKGKTYALKDIHDGLFRLEASNLFSYINYELVKNGSKTINDKSYDNYTLNIYLQENNNKDLKFAVNYNNQDYASIIFDFNLRHTYFSGSELNIKGKLNQNPAFKIRHSLITGWDFGLGLDSEIFANNFDVEIFENNAKIGEFEVINYGFKQDIGSILFNDMYIGAGYLKNYMKISTSYNNSGYTDGDADDYNSLYFFIKSDTKDNSYYPRRGHKLDFYFKFFAESFSELRHFPSPKIEASYEYNTKFFVDHCYLSYKTVNGFSFGENNDDLFDYYFLGGEKINWDNFIPFAGVTGIEDNYRNITTSRFQLMYEFLPENFIAVNFSKAIVADKFSDLKNSDAEQFHTIGLSLGGNSMLGPVELSLYKLKDQDDLFFYLSLGYPFQ